MTFRRTSSGLSNLHLFLGVDAVVFTEGGSNTYSFTQVISGSFNSQVLDLLFWEKLFKLFSPSLRLNFRAIGSKPVCNSIADEILSGTIKNVYVGMDRDFDNLKSSLKKGAGIFYTFGYSWENDVWHEKIIEEIFFALCPSSDIKDAVSSEILICFEQFRKDIKWAVYADILLSCSNTSAFFTRGKPESFLICLKNKMPLVNRQKIRLVLQDKNTKKLTKIYSNQPIRFEIIQDCYGHLIASFSYKLLVYLINKFSGLPSLPKDYAYALGIEKFFNRINDGEFSEVHKHYEDQFTLLFS